MTDTDDNLKKQIAFETGYEVKPDTNYEVEIIPEGDYDAVLQGIVNIGVYPGWEGKPPEVKIKFIFELPEVVRGEEQLPVMVGKKVKLSAYIKSTKKTGGFDSGFFLLLTALGEKPTSDNILQYLTKDGLSSLLGKTCVVKISHWESDNGPAAKVASLAKLDIRLPQPKGVRETFYFSPYQADVGVFNNKLTYYTKKDVMEALDASTFSAELQAAWIKAQNEQDAKEAIRTKVELDINKINTAAVE